MILPVPPSSQTADWGDYLVSDDDSISAIASRRAVYDPNWLFRTDNETCEALDTVESPGLAEAPSHYRALGSAGGAYATYEGTQDERSFWRETGAAGAKWLAHQIHDEHDSDILAAAANRLADIGPAAVHPILDVLEHGPSDDQASALLKALGWIAPAERRLPAGRIARVIRSFLASDDPDLRESAVAATRILLDDTALPLLQSALRDESDSVVADTIREAIFERSPE